MSAEDLFVGDSAEEESFRENKSFSKYREAQSIMIDETDSEMEVDSTASRSESDEESEEERMVHRMKKRQSMRMSLHPPRREDSDSEDESEAKSFLDASAQESVLTDDEAEDEAERQLENRAYSPSTRMSMHGVSAVLSSGQESDDEPLITHVKARKPVRAIISSDDDDDGDEDDASDKNDDDGATKHQNPSREKETPENGSSFDESLPLRSFDAENAPVKDRNGNSSDVKEADDSISTKLSSTLKTDEERSEGEVSFAGRHSISVRASIGEKLSSTHIAQNNEVEDRGDPVQEGSGRDESSSLKLIEKSTEILTVSSDDGDDDVKFQGETKPTVQQPVQRRSVQNLVQPTITAFVRGPVERVSQSEYDAKVRQMADLKSQLVMLEGVLKNGARLPDKGAGLVRRLAEIKAQIFELAKVIEVTRATPRKNIKQAIRQSFDNSLQSVENSRNTSANSSTEQNHISWDAIKKATDDIQPRHTGKQGIATFENQKLLTMDRLATLHKSIETCPSEDTLADPPKLLKIELMNHQRHALAWMLWRETQKPRGGILADDMGLGKTLSMISLVLKSAELDPDGDLLGQDSASEDDLEGSLKAKNNNGWKAKGRKDFYAGGTLIVCPASLMRQWEAEITNRVKRNSLAVSVHHGTQRETKPRYLAKYDVVITTYNIVSRENKDESRAGGGVFGVSWERIILDEAHVIRNHKSVMSESCCALKGRCRWVLTGTPIQNKEMDVYALMKFLRCSPFNDLVHWKRWIDNKTAGGAMRLNTIMKSIMLRRTKKQLQERGSLNSLPQKTVELIEVQLEKEEMNVYQKVLLYSKSLFAQFLHQRAEKEQASNYIYGGNRPTFAQRGAPNGAFDKVHQKLKRMHGDGSEVQQHQILVLLLRLRQICCHPGLIHQMLSDDDDADKSNLNMSSIDADCGDANEVDLLGQLNKLKLSDVIAEHEAKTNAANGEAGEVSLDLLEEFDRPEVMAKALTKVMLRSNPVFRMDRSSSKIERVMQLLEEKIFSTDDKAIIVSQWTSMLEILGQQLTRRHIHYVSLTGKVPVKLRNDIVVEFNKPTGKAKIMLLSLTAGGVGLNLVGANHLFLLDPHWNPQLEAQAQDRVYRVGQTKTVYIWKFMCVETVEQKILALQQHKLGIAEGVLTGTANKGSKLTMDDLKSLFGL
ncbi:transcription termination factor 2 [Anopheles ziemanni]|uniref:transcription termination factor 2 n=1 Tax=Anopheles coustani TaxID=139045 RepID=UPI0026591B7B|nr:transcription termination factor 2 [Anopheles coustani]XP_058174102.1 transcription termination factor 2 [Anopheles ziemanni]